MVSPRQLHTATLLSNGKVLVAGGDGANSSAELFDPSVETFSSTGSMLEGRDSFTATLLNNGKVLVAGGRGLSNSPLASAELYDPGTGTFTPTGSMLTGRFGHTATLLKGGQVFMAGGVTQYGSTATQTAEIYDPNTGTFTATGNMTTPRDHHAATLLGDGRVLLTGVDTTAELYDPNTRTFAATVNMSTARGGHTATLLETGKVLIVGGIQPQGNFLVSLASTELFDPANGAFAPTGNLAVPRGDHTATSMKDGTVLVAGGVDASGGWLANLAAAEIFDPTKGTFTPVGTMAHARVGHTATLLNDGRVLVVGGRDLDDSLTTTAEIFQ